MLATLDVLAVRFERRLVPLCHVYSPLDQTGSKRPIISPRADGFVGQVARRDVRVARFWLAVDEFDPLVRHRNWPLGGLGRASDFLHVILRLTIGRHAV